MVTVFAMPEEGESSFLSRTVLSMVSVNLWLYAAVTTFMLCYHQPQLAHETLVVSSISWALVISAAIVTLVALKGGVRFEQLVEVARYEVPPWRVSYSARVEIKGCNIVTENAWLYALFVQCALHHLGMCLSLLLLFFWGPDPTTSQLCLHVWASNLKTCVMIFLLQFAAVCHLIHRAGL